MDCKKEVRGLCKAAYVNVPHGQGVHKYVNGGGRTRYRKMPDIASDIEQAMTSIGIIHNGEEIVRVGSLRYLGDTK